MELQFATAKSIDVIILWTIGITFIRLITSHGSSPLSRVNEYRGAGAEESGNRGKDWMDSGGSGIKGDVRRRVVHSPDNRYFFGRRFKLRQKYLERQRSQDAADLVAESVSPDRTALRASWYQAIREEAQNTPDCITTGVTAGTVKE